MTACFWGSTHHKLLVRDEDLQASHDKDRQRGLADEHIRQLDIYFVKYIQELTQSTLPLLRQRVAASACFFFRRFYLSTNFCEWDPRAVAPACVYLASKSEEAPLQAKYLVQYVRKAAARYGHPPPEYDVKALLDLELVLLDHLRYDLVVFSPYDCLQSLLQDVSSHVPGGLPPSSDPNRATASLDTAASDASAVQGGAAGADAASGAAGAHVAQALATDTWGAVTDSYCTDAPLLHAPHAIAIGALLTAATLRGIDLGAWLSGLQVDLEAVGDVSMRLMSLYRRGGPSPVHPEVCQRYMDILQLTAPALPLQQQPHLAAAAVKQQPQKQ